VTESLEKRTNLKEYTIATQVFGRGDQYDPRVDSVVRVQASRLRSKLLEFYSSEGKDDHIIIELPKGHYTPIVSYLPNGSRSEAASHSPIVAGLSNVRHRPGLWPYYAAVSALFIAIFLGAVAIYYRSQAQQAVKGASSSTSPPPETFPLWSDFLNSREPVLVAYSNAVFRATPTGLKLLKPLTTADKDSEAGVAGTLQGTGANDLIIDYYTGVGEVAAVLALGNFFSRADKSFALKRSLVVTWEDFKTANMIILGSTAENLILRQLPQKQDFIFRLVSENRMTRFGIINLRPRPGEGSAFFTKPDGSFTSRTTEDYALISLLQGFDSKHKLMIIAGMTTFGTQAAAEYMTRPEYIADMTRHLNTAPSGQPPSLPRYYQVIVRIKVNGGVPVETSYVTHHVLGM
jgi:hypothetical protein